MACCLEFSKNVTFFINCVIFLLSCTVGVGCVLILTKLTPALEEALEPPKLSVICLLSMSVVSVLISFCGCMGAAKGSPCLLLSYGLMLIAIAILTCAATGLIMEFSKDIETLTEKGLDKLIENYKPLPANSSKINTIDDIQQMFKCCGSRNLSSWDSWKQSHSNLYPASCCADPKSQGCENPHSQTCLGIVSKVFEDGSKVAIIAGFSTALVLFVSAVSSCVLARAFANQRDSIIDSNRYYGRITV